MSMLWLWLAVAVALALAVDGAVDMVLDLAASFIGSGATTCTHKKINWCPVCGIFRFSDKKQDIKNYNVKESPIVN